MKVYRIRDKETGLWSCGGSFPRFSEKGKVWRSKQALGGHLALFTCNYFRRQKSHELLKNWEIVEYEISETAGRTVNAWDYSKDRTILG